MADETGRSRYQSTPVPLAQCNQKNCAVRIRVLPEEILPYKRYALVLIEKAIGLYAQTEQGLEPAALKVGGDTPDYTTLWRWTAGLGNKVLGRLDSLRGSLPMSAIIEQTSRRIQFELREWWKKSFPIARFKYRTQGRAEQLEGCARLLHSATKLFGEEPNPLTGWHRETLRWWDVPAWVFPAQFCCTSLQIGPQGPYAIGSSSEPRKKEKESNHESRSPPSSLLAL